MTQILKLEIEGGIAPVFNRNQGSEKLKLLFSHSNGKLLN